MATGARFFQFYLDNYFKFPKEIKNDIIYCQRAFHAHLKVHQLVVTKIKPNDSLYPHKEKILHEIEDEMILINGEQNYLLLRLRRVIDEFFKTVQRGGIPIDQELTNQLIFKEVGPQIHDTRNEILPVSVSYRSTEEKLMEKYFHAQTFTPHEIIDITDDDIVIVESKSAPAADIKLETVTPSPPTVAPTPATTLNGQHVGRNANNTNHLSQVSLLKPISQRMVTNLKHNIGTRSLYPEQAVMSSNRTAQNGTLSSTTYGRATAHEGTRNSTDTANASKEDPPITLPVSKNVTLSRLNLQQALKKAKTETMAAKASANVLIKPTAAKVNAPAPTATPALSTAAPPTNVVKPKLEPKTKSSLKASLRSALTEAVRPIGRPPKTRVVSTSPSSSSSSEELSPERETTPPQAALTQHDEEVPQQTQPEDFGQEMFLRIFGLVTPEMHVQMQQRRSKRKRRTVQSKERADFHYGRIEYTFPPTDDKNKKKAFLLSPQVKRNKKRKEKISDLPLSRSGSSSPDEKRACNECLKRGGALDQCKECKGYFHQICHPPDAAETKLTTMSTAAKRSLTVEHKKFCPACHRMQMSLIKKEAKQYETLNSTVHELKQKLAHEKHRRASLQQTSKLYKTQMRNLFNIVNTIKSDNELDSSD